METTSKTSTNDKWLKPTTLFCVAILASVAIGLSIYAINSGMSKKDGKNRSDNELTINGYAVEGDVFELANEFKTENVTVYSEGEHYVNLNGFSYYGFDDCSIAFRGTPRTNRVYTVEVSLPYTDNLSVLKERYFSIRDAFLKRYNATSSSDYVELHMDVLASANSISDLHWQQMAIGHESRTPETKISNINNGEIRILIWCHSDRGTIFIFFNNLNNTDLRQQEINKNKEEGRSNWLDEL